ncbi:MAG: hypothetical protein IKZ46_11720 [Victivallales bacterium]|nr:hypothetical protein [Victivallales bacterium]
MTGSNDGVPAVGCIDGVPAVGCNDGVPAVTPYCRKIHARMETHVDDAGSGAIRPIGFPSDRTNQQTP